VQFVHNEAAGDASFQQVSAMRIIFSVPLHVVLLFAGGLTSPGQGEERRQKFDRDPGWDGRNHRATTPEPQEIRQEFGYGATRHAGGESPGEIGGFLTPAAEPAYYAKRIPPANFGDRLTASGKFAAASPHFHVLVGFFNSQTVNEWRTPNSIFLRLYGRGDVFYAYVEYATSRWRAGGDSPGGFASVADPETGKPQLKGFASQGAVHTWSLVYDPNATGGAGSITAVIDGETAVCHLDEGHKADGARFDRFGLLSIPKSYDTGGEVWLDDITVNGELEDFAKDPNWEAVGNRRTYASTGVRPRFNFGYSQTHFAGGERRGELGGVVFRGDVRYPDKLAYYGDRLESLSLDKPIMASGRVSLRRGVSDSTTLFGFFHSEDSVAVTDSQASGFPVNFLGVAIEGPSREGFLFYPAYRFIGDAQGYARGPELPHILPNGESAAWSLEYNPGKAGAAGRIAVTYNDQKVFLDVPREHREAPARFNRFGIVTTWIDGNAQHVYFDDLMYTCRN
jgi:hypothetical protein